MENQATRPARWLDYFVLAARFYLAGIFLLYGGAKLVGGQFGITPAEAAQPLQQLSLFKVYWYLCAFEPFKTFVGAAQVLAALLLLYHRTALLGALLLLPIAANILVADIAYLKMEEFYWRLPFYLALILLILWHYRDRMLVAYRALTQGLSTRFAYSWRAWAALPLALLAVELLGRLPRIVLVACTHPAALARWPVSAWHYWGSVWQHWQQ